MHYLNITTVKFFILMILMISTSECSTKKKEEKSLNNSTLIKKNSLQTYFQISSDRQDYNNFYLINKILKLKESVDLDSDLEIRILSSKDFSDHIYYRFIYQNSNWRGEIYTIENLTLVLKEVKPFTPINGWKKLEESLVDNDILNIPDFDYEGNYLHPKTFDIQLITKRNMKIISLQDFYSKENKSDIYYIKIENLMKVIFGKNYISKILVD